MKAAREHAEIDFYQECMTFKPLHYSAQDTVRILLDKGLTFEQAYAETAHKLYVSKDLIRTICQRG